MRYLCLEQERIYGVTPADFRKEMLLAFTSLNKRYIFGDLDPAIFDAILDVASIAAQRCLRKANSLEVSE